MTTARFTLRVIAIAVTTVLIFGNRCSSADKAKIDESIRKAQAYLLKQKLTGPVGTIAAFAYIKSGGDKNAAPIQQIIREVLQKFPKGGYKPIQHHNYEAAVDMMLLETVDAKLYRPQIEAGVGYVTSTQLANGSWYYPDKEEPDCCDTSITQYAMLGLWAANRAGVDIPPEVLERTARWHIARQKSDGGFAYQPFDRKSGGEPEERISVSTMTAAGSSSLLIIRRMLFGEVSFDLELRPTNSKRRFGVLERFSEDKSNAKRDGTIRVASIDDSLKQSMRWIINHFGVKSHRHEIFFTYDFYSLERVAALLDVDEFGTHDWYNEGSDELLTRQISDGSWNDMSGSVAATSMALMFLTKTTAKIINPKPRVNLLGSGLQAGGRGLPDNLNAVQVKDGAVSARKIVGPVDNLLIELERSADAKVADVQAAVVDAVQLDRPDDLIGQVPRLKRLASDSRQEVRRTAIWALGRSGDASATPSLINGLSDPDDSIVREASLALCILSRRPEGCGIAIDPSDDSQLGLNDDTTDEQRSKVLNTWRTESIKRWTEWYMKNRNYEERDDRTTLRKTNK